MGQRGRGFGGPQRGKTGSDFQVKLWVNRNQVALNQQVINALPDLEALGGRIRWVSPLESEDYYAVKGRKLLTYLDIEDSWEAFASFWPHRGQWWDALAQVTFPRAPERRGAILVEAKSHLGELESHCTAEDGPDREKICRALEKTKEWLGVPTEMDWLTSNYQRATRLAHLYFLRKVLGLNAWLIYVYFISDPYRPTTLPVWVGAAASVDRAMGLADEGQKRYFTDLYLKAL